MGGYGSSRWRWYHKKCLVEQAALVLDSHQLMKDAVCMAQLTHLMFVPTPDGPWRFRPVDVRREGERHITVRWFNHTARVAMQTTPALGGPCGGGLLVQCVSAAAGSSISCMWTPP